MLNGKTSQQKERFQQKNSKMQYKLFFFLDKTLNRKKQKAQRKILRMGRILSVLF